MQGKLSPKDIGPYKVIEKLNHIAYRLDLSVELKHICNVFHIPQWYPSTYEEVHSRS